MESKIKFPVKSKIGKKIVTVVFTMFIGLIFLLGVVSDGILLYGTISPPDPSIWVLVLIGQVLASFVVFLVPIATILLVLIRIRRSKGLNLKRRWWIVVFLLGAVVSAPMALHLNAQHVSSLKAENAFTEGWGQGWQKQIDPPTENYPRSTAPWMDIPFNAWNWVFGSPIVHDRYQVTEDVQYLENENYTLKLDVYEPLSNDGLWDYGPYPTIMVLHPGSWKYMDKGYA